MHLLFDGFDGTNELRARRMLRSVNPWVISRTSTSTPLDGGCMSMHAGLVWPLAGQLRYASRAGSCTGSGRRGTGRGAGDDRYDARTGSGSAGRGGAGRHRHGPQRRYECDPHDHGRQRRSVPGDQPVDRQLRAHGRTLGIHEIRPHRADVGGQPGCGRERRPAGRWDRGDGSGHVRRLDPQHDDIGSRRPFRYEAHRRAAGHQQPRHVQPGAVGGWRQSARRRTGGLRGRRRTSRSTACGRGRTIS